VTSEVEERIHKALTASARAHRAWLPARPPRESASARCDCCRSRNRRGQQVVAVAEITAEYEPAGLPSFHPSGVQRLNRMAVYGAYELREDQLRQTAKVSIYANEPAAHLVAQSILNAFGGQLPIGRSAALATMSAAVLEQQRAHHAMPREWNKPPDEESLRLPRRSNCRGRDWRHPTTPSSVWAELPMSGDCPSRSIDPRAETALLQVNTTTMPHPIAGAGYLATIFLPLPKPPADSTEICRRLNELDLEHLEFAPRLGAWGLHGPEDLPGYTCFFPSAEPIARISHGDDVVVCAARRLDQGPLLGRSAGDRARQETNRRNGLGRRLAHCRSIWRTLPRSVTQGSADRNQI
jgi:hypothetical protein